MAGTRTTHAAAPQGPSHIAPIVAQPPKTMATGPSKTQMAKAKNEAGYELRVLHLMGRHKKSAEYEVFHGDASQLTKLDQRKR